MLFSIITPTYNRADKIGVAIQSVLRQDYQNFELIIVDDGSTDNTKEVVQNFDDPRILYFKKKNEERNIARNYGIAKANGQYIGFLDSDDFLYNHHLQQAHNFILEKKYPEIIHLNFRITGLNTSSSFITQNSIKNVNKELINENFISCNSIFIRKEIFSQFQFLNSKYAILGEDYYLWLRLASRYKIHLSQEITSAVTEHPDRSLNKIDVDRLAIGISEIHETLKKDYKFTHYYGWKSKKYFALNYIFIALHLILQSRKKESLQYLKRALVQFPFSLFTRKFLTVLKKNIF